MNTASTAFSLEPLPTGGGSLRNILTVDVENWYHVPYENATRYLLDLFDEHGARATFFVVGYVAERTPGLVRDIAARGHEIGSHGLRHTPLQRMTPAALKEELSRALAVLGNITGAPVVSFRAPVFSLVEQTYWAFDVMASLEMKYDSSVFPIAGARYGVPGFPRGAVRVTCPSGTLIELPLSTVRHAGRNWPVSGGGYFRLMPYPVIRWAVRAVNAEGMPFVAYCHPYEFGEARLRHRRGSSPFGWLKSRRDELTQNMFRSSMRGKFARLLGGFPFTSIREAFDDHA
ncbi:DUF3473 domain-containing protein [bacterium]|nr:DUF3473 domain-containing protein [bacterium]